MAKTTTTLAGAIGPSDTQISTANNAAMRTGDNIVVGTETMRALVVDPAIGATVFRGSRGTAGQAASAGATLNYGPPTDWGAGVGVTMLPMEFEKEAAADVAAEDAEKLAERVEKKRKELEKKAAEEAEKQQKAADKAAADAKAAADKTAHPAAHK